MLIVLSYPFYPLFAQRGGISPLSPPKRPLMKRPLGCRPRKPQDASGTYGTRTHARAGPHNVCELGEKGTKRSTDQPR